ncbi:hypothetical protein BG006_010530 [Podila minutissima]|uniref:FAD-binding domain-containing protein n=1 Tax=Podila minutissima TaxID=64525 RepID=A0A9P5VIJ1_9FUNG|nr:hypothetical protein BG006_010530 [Podila minutissima]
MPGQTALPTSHTGPLPKKSFTPTRSSTKISPDPMRQRLLPTPEPARVKVVIAGGGIGGLALAIMFEAAKNIDYVVLERSSTHKTLGSTIGLNARPMRMLEQLGLLADIKKISKPIGGFNLQNEDRSPIGHIDFTFGEREYGYGGCVMSRPALFELLLSRVPEDKVLLSKQVSNVIETSAEVRVICADGSEYGCDILVGSDGAYSAVREIMYKKLSTQGRLPASDSKPMEMTHVCVLGVSEPMDPVKYPRLMDTNSNFEMTLFRDKPLSVLLSPISDNRISWCYGGEVDPNAPKTEAWNWGHHTDLKSILPEIKNLATEYGPSVGAVIESTSRDMVLPFAGQGCIHAMLDGISLTNLLASLKSTSPEVIEQLLKTHVKSRHDSGRNAVIGSRLFGRFIESKGFIARWIRRICFMLIPHWLVVKMFNRVMRDRPTLSFLPPVKERGVSVSWSN